MVPYKRNYKPRRRANNPVAKAITKYKDYNKKVKNTKRYVANNRTAIMTLSRQVKSLQLSKIGAYQKKFESLNLGAGTFSASKPLLIQLNNLLDNATVWYPTFNTTNNTPQINAAGVFTKTQPAIPENREHCSYWVNSNDDEPSREFYKPIRRTITVKFDNPTGYSNTERDQWFRIDIFRQKKVLPETSVHHLNLPHNLYGLINMANDAPERNRFNKEYFQVYKTFWKKATPSEVNGRRQITYMKIDFQFPAKHMVKLNTVNGINDGDLNDITQYFRTNIPVDEVYYAMISTNYKTDEQDCKIQLNSFSSWRDQHGITS